MMLWKATIATAACTFALVGGSAAAAFAGEVTGNGKLSQGAIHANSPCAFSGLNDQSPEEGGSGVVQPGEVQNWGHTRGTPVVISAPRGASDLVIDFGGGTFEWGCNGHLHGQHSATP
jgi:hypothetical protein